MSKYAASLFVWPYSGVSRGDACKAVTKEEPHRGARSPCVTVTAESFHEAVRKVDLIVQGIMLDERVWRAGIEDIRKIKR